MTVVVTMRWLDKDISYFGLVSSVPALLLVSIDCETWLSRLAETVSEDNLKAKEKNNG